MRSKAIIIGSILLLLAALPAAANNCATSGVNPNSSAPVSNTIGMPFANANGQTLVINPQIFVPAVFMQGLSKWQLASTVPMAPRAVVIPGGYAADNISTPNAQAAFAGTYYVTGVLHTQPGAGDLDGTLAAGMGFGPASNAVEIGATIADVSDIGDVLFNAKFHFFNETESAPGLAVGVENIFGASPAQEETSAYLVASKSYWDMERINAERLAFAKTAVSVGYGSGRYGNSPFAAVSTSLSGETKAIGEYIDKGFNVGFSWAANKPGNLVVVAGWQDIFGDSSLTLGIGMGFYRFR
ncbi:MAG: YjbH domain-containing protein [bacterium]|nr:YjbH domain-containing protein [bacterium]